MTVVQDEPYGRAYRLELTYHYVASGALADEEKRRKDTDLAVLRALAHYRSLHSTGEEKDVPLEDMTSYIQKMMGTRGMAGEWGSPSGSNVGVVRGAGMSTDDGLHVIFHEGVGGVMPSAPPSSSDGDTDAFGEVYNFSDLMGILNEANRAQEGEIEEVRGREDHLRPPAVDVHRHGLGKPSLSSPALNELFSSQGPLSGTNRGGGPRGRDRVREGSALSREGSRSSLSHLAATSSGALRSSLDQTTTDIGSTSADEEVGMSLMDDEPFHEKRSGRQVGRMEQKRGEGVSSVPLDLQRQGGDEGDEPPPAAHTESAVYSWGPDVGAVVTSGASIEETSNGPGALVLARSRAWKHRDGQVRSWRAREVGERDVEDLKREAEYIKVRKGVSILSCFLSPSVFPFRYFSFWLPSASLRFRSLLYLFYFLSL